MDIKAMKNMVVLKDLPSNVVEEAFVILKKNVKIHKEELLENNKKSKSESKLSCDMDDFVIKEAELILQEYIDNIEVKNYIKTQKNIKDINKKYKRLKALTMFLGMFSLILSVLNLIR